MRGPRAEGGLPSIELPHFEFLVNDIYELPKMRAGEEGELRALGGGDGCLRWVLVMQCRWVTVARTAARGRGALPSTPSLTLTDAIRLNLSLVSASHMNFSPSFADDEASSTDHHRKQANKQTNTPQDRPRGLQVLCGAPQQVPHRLPH